MLSRALCVSFCLWVSAFGVAEGGTTTTLVRADTLSARDATLLSGSPNQRNGTSTDLIIRDTKNANRGNAVLDFNLPNLAGRTVLQAWLRMRQFAGSKSRLSAVRVYPVTQGWVENEVTWNERSAGIAWATPGGSYAPYSSDRILAASTTVGTLFSWQVGPILAAYANGAFGISGSGFLLKADGTAPDREVRFRSSEYSDTTSTPLLEITSTDLPPAVASAWAEVQPHQAAEFQSAFFTVYLEEDLSGSTPSGAPTGFDMVRLQHGGALLVTGISAVTVGTTSIPPASVSFANDVNGCTIQLPQPVTQNARVAIRFQATVQVGVASREFTLPVFVRRSTSAAGLQAVWPQNADGIPGNGDNLIVTVFSTTTSVHILSVSGPATLVPGQNDAPFQMRVRNTGAQTVSISSADLSFTRSSPGDADPEFQVAADPANPDTLFPGAEKVLGLKVDVLPSAIPGPLTVDGQLVVLDVNTGIAYADLSADTTQAVTVTVSGGGLLMNARQSLATVLPGARDVELLSLGAWNRSATPTALTRLAVSNTTFGPGTTAQLDAEVDTLALYADNGNGVFVPGTETLLGKTIFSGGSATFDSLSVSIPAQDSVRFYLAGDISLEARDGDVLDLAVPEGAITVSPDVAFENTWPIAPAGSSTVDGMAAAQLTVYPVPSHNLTPGTARELVLDLGLPGNGYQADVLQRMNVINAGTAAPGTDLAKLELWRDQGAPGFNALEDRLLGSMSFTGARWEITGLNEPIPVTGARVFVTADVSPTTPRPSTLQLVIPAGDQGVGMVSQNSGPLDAAVGNPNFLLITIPDRVTVVADSVGSGTVAPGAQDLILLDATAANTYSTSRTLNEITFASTGTGAGTRSQQDGNLRVLHLRWDANRNGILDDLVADPLLGTASFSNGKVHFAGFNAVVAANTSERFFLTADVSLGASDGDVLGAAISGPLDLVFAEPTTLEGVWPVTSAASWKVDGLIADQVQVVSGGASSLGPGSGPDLAFDFQLPGNGYQNDALNGLRVVNLGGANSGDLSELRLWKDGGNGSFDTGSGDDVDLGALVPVGNGWQSLSMSVPLTTAGTRFFVSVSVSPTFTDSALVRLAIPVNGVLVASGDDGPVDRTVESAHVIELSDAPLLAQLALNPTPSTTGQVVGAVLTVENRSSETINDIAPGPLTQTGTGSFGPPTGPLPASWNLAPGASGTFQWTLPPSLAGDVTLSARATGTGATSLLPQSSLLGTSTLHHIYEEAVSLRVSALEFMPYSVTIGQGDIVPLNLTFTNPGTAFTSPVELSSMRIRIEDENGAGLIPSALLSGVVISEGQTIFCDKSAIENTGSTVDLTLGPPFQRARVSPGDPVTLSLQLHLIPTTSISKFRIVIQDASWLPAQDAISTHPVTVTLDTGTFPIRTGLANVVSEAVQVRARGAIPDTVHVDPGQSGVTLLDFSLENVPGSGAASTVRVGSLTLRATDAAGAPLARPDSLCASLSLEAAGSPVALLTLTAAGGDSLLLTLSPPVTLLEGSPVALRLVGHMSDTATPGSIRFRLGAESSLDARDANTGNRIPVTYLPSPLWGNFVFLENRAQELRVAGTPIFPATLTVGEKGVHALDLEFEHPGSAGTARIAVDSLTLAVRDDRGQLLAPGPILDRVSVVWKGQEIAVQGLLASSPQLVSLALPGTFLSAGEIASASIVVDIDAGAPATSFQITLHADGISARDANLGAPVSVLPLGGATFPFTSGLTQIRSPSRELDLGLQSLLPAALAADGSEVRAAQISLANPAPDGATAIRIRWLRIAAADRNRTALAVGSAVSRVALFRNGALWVENAALSVDSTTAWIGFPAELSIQPGKTEILELRATLSTTATAPSLRLGFDRADVGIVQPGGAALAIALVPAGGQTFPLWTEAGNFGSLSLEKSYANFPNPFAAGREQTAFVYYLPENGRVTLRIWTLRGDEVATVIRSGPRPAGLHQEDHWDGRNGSGETVLNGVYLAELVVAFDDGTSKRLLRKVAVVR